MFSPAIRIGVARKNVVLFLSERLGAIWSPRRRLYFMKIIFAYLQWNVRLAKMGAELRLEDWAAAKCDNWEEKVDIASLTTMLSLVINYVWSFCLFNKWKNLRLNWVIYREKGIVGLIERFVRMVIIFWWPLNIVLLIFVIYTLTFFFFFDKTVKTQ